MAEQKTVFHKGTPLQREKDRIRQAKHREKKAHSTEEGAEEVQQQIAAAHNFRSSKTALEIQQAFTLAYERAKLGKYITRLELGTYPDALAFRSRCYAYRNQLFKESPLHTEDMQVRINYYMTFELGVQGKAIHFTQADHNPVYAGIMDQILEMQQELEENTSQETDVHEPTQRLRTEEDANDFIPPLKQENESEKVETFAGDMSLNPEPLLIQEFGLDEDRGEDLSSEQPTNAPDGTSWESYNRRFPSMETKIDNLQAPRPASMEDCDGIETVIGQKKGGLVFTTKGWKHEDSVQAQLALKQFEKENKDEK